MQMILKIKKKLTKNSKFDKKKKNNNNNDNDNDNDKKKSKDKGQHYDVK